MQAARHSPKFSLAVALDTRDDELSPVRGVYVAERLDVAPGTFGAADYGYARVGTVVHAFVPVFPRDRRLVLALRAANDMLFGDPDAHPVSGHLLAGHMF